MVIDGAEIEKAVALIRGHNTAVVLGHEHPDGDAIGSALGLGLMLEGAGYRVIVSWPHPFTLPHKFRFLPGMRMLAGPRDIPADGILFTVDCANLDRLEVFKPAISSADAVINIDHHPDNSRFGNVNIVNPSAAATAEILYLAASELGLKICLEAAVCLYTGIVTDTGKFQFANTTATTLMVASEMVSMGVDISEIYGNIYQSDSLAYIKLAGKILEGAVFDEDMGLIYVCVTLGELERSGVNMEETEDLIDSLRALRGHNVAAVFKETRDGRIRVSLRSRDNLDIGSVARRLGGGGHMVAAGYTSKARNMEDAVVELREELIAGERSPAG